MKIVKRVLLLLVLFSISNSVRSMQVFYVGSGSECSSAAASPCHSLQYYANYSNFTDNSIFHFFPGDHQLGSVVTIKGLVNLSLIGDSFKARIVCNSFQSGFRIEDFNNLTILNLTISDCGYDLDTKAPAIGAIFLSDGSDLFFRHVKMSSIYATTGAYKELLVKNVTGSFSIHNSTFYSPGGYGVAVLYPFSDKFSYFEFVDSEASSVYFTGLYLGLISPNVQAVVSNSIFKLGDLTVDDVQVSSLQADFFVVTNNSIKISNSKFVGDVTLPLCDIDPCTERDYHCNPNFVELSGISSNRVLTGVAGNCTVTIENSNLLNLTVKNVAPNRNIANMTQARLHNVTIANGKLGPVSIINAVVSFENCTIKDNTNSAFFAMGSRVIFLGSNLFRNNSGLVGGAMRLISTYIDLKSNTTVLFEGNRADYVGGGIYVESIKGQDMCFYNILPSLNDPLDGTAKMVFVNNTARLGGSALYGGGLNCTSYERVINVFNSEEDPSAVAGEPYKVCLCGDESQRPNCSSGVYASNAYPGQDFTIRLAVVSIYDDGIVPGAIRAYLLDTTSNISLKFSQISQASDGPFCKDFNYSVYSTQEYVSFRLSAEQTFFEALADVQSGVLIDSSILKISVTVNLKECPLGFNLSSKGDCVCDHILLNHNVIQCDINEQSILVPDNAWIGFINETESSNETENGVIYHPNCPFGYCLPSNVSVTSSAWDNQCDLHRTGLLCGMCEEGYSLTLGRDRCAKCSSIYLLLIAPIAVLGLLLVGILFALNLTVTEGTVNGLIFYANVIAMSRTVLTLEEKSYLYTFVAWINLDLGIETCFFNSMDGYAATWLQFVFPIYLWTIIFAIILFYRRFPRIAQRLGRDSPIKVLATLLLLSYTKLQQTVVTILSFTTLEFPSGAVRYVWLYDANVEFFRGKHLYLGLAGILTLVFLIVPYTLCLVFFQQLQACSEHRFFQWVNQLKPLFDSYAGPYNDRYRFWTGLLLVVRTVLIVLFTINTTESTEFNLLVILVVSSALAWGHTSAIYKKWSHNYLESSFYLQLAIFASSMFYAKYNHGNIAAVAYTSIGMSMVVFVVLVGYHIFHRIASFKKQSGYEDIGNMDSFVYERKI